MYLMKCYYMFDAMRLIRFALQCAMMQAVSAARLKRPACVLNAIQCVVVILLHLMKCHDMFDAMCLIGFAQQCAMMRTAQTAFMQFIVWLL